MLKTPEASGARFLTIGVAAGVVRSDADIESPGPANRWPTGNAEAMPRVLSPPRKSRRVDDNFALEDKIGLQSQA